LCYIDSMSESKKRGNPAWVKGGSSPNPAGRSKRSDSRKADGYQSAITGAGVIGRDKTTGVTFTADQVGWTDAVEYWRGDDLAARIIETLPNEMLRQGFDLQITDEDENAYEGGKAAPEADPEEKSKGKASPFGKSVKDVLDPKAKSPKGPEKSSNDPKELQELISSKWEDMGLIPALWEATCYERAYGGSAILLGALDNGKPDKPLNEDQIRSFDWLTVLEPQELTPVAWYNDPQAPKYGRPALYRLAPVSPGPSTNFKTPSTMQTVHESRLIVFPGIRVSRSMQNMSTGWGDSVLTRAVRVLQDFNMSWRSAAVLLQDFAQAVYKIEGLAELFANDQGDVVKERIKAVDYMRSSVRAILIDSTEEFKREQTPMSGLPELLELFCKRLAAAADMPMTLLFGESPGGLSATGDSDIRLFYDRVRSAQDRKLRGPIERVCKLLFRAMGKDEPANWSVCFKPLWQPTEKEQAEARKIQAETDQIYITNAVLSAEEIAISRFKSDEFSFQTHVDFEMREAMEPVAESPAKTSSQIETEEMEREAKAAEFELKASALNAKPGAKGE
jgi:phage-related protein (TIGR01555 family)